MTVFTVRITKSQAGKTKLCKTFSGQVSDSRWHALAVKNDFDFSLNNCFPPTCRTNSSLGRIVFHRNANRSISKTDLPRQCIVTCDCPNIPVEIEFLSVLINYSELGITLVNLHRANLVVTNTQGGSSVIVHSNTPTRILPPFKFSPELVSTQHIVCCTLGAIECLKHIIGENYCRVIVNTVLCGALPRQHFARFLSRSKCKSLFCRLSIFQQHLFQIELPIGIWNLHKFRHLALRKKFLNTQVQSRNYFPPTLLSLGLCSPIKQN